MNTKFSAFCQKFSNGFVKTAFQVSRGSLRWNENLFQIDLFLSFLDKQQNNFAFGFKFSGGIFYPAETYGENIFSGICFFLSFWDNAREVFRLLAKFFGQIFLMSFLRVHVNILRDRFLELSGIFGHWNKDIPLSLKKLQNCVVKTAFYVAKGTFWGELFSGSFKTFC